MSIPSTLRRTVAASALMALAVGFATTTPSLGATPEGHGALTVQPSPSVATQITVDGVARNQSAIVDLPLVAGQHRVCLSAAPGYLPPPCQLVDIVEGQKTSIAPAYTRSGTLLATTEPSQSEAVISVDGVARDAGEVRVPLPVGVHDVCFGAVTGMTTPPCAEVDIVADATVSIVGSYEPEGTVPAPEPEPEPSVEAASVVELVGAAESSGGNKPWSALVTIGLDDADGRPLAGVTVTGTWTLSRPSVSVVSSCTTGADGTCRVEARDMSTGAGNTAIFVVDDVAGFGSSSRSGHSSVTINRNGSVSVTG